MSEDIYCPNCGQKRPCVSSSIPAVIELDFDIVISRALQWTCSLCGTLFTYRNSEILRGDDKEHGVRIKK